MSSSTSTSELPAPPSPAAKSPPRDRRSLGLLTGALVLLLGGLALFNAWQDPYAFFGGRPGIVIQSGATANLPLSALLEVNRIPNLQVARAEVAIVGDSRCRHLSGERAATVSGHPLVNLACGGATLEESLTILNLTEPRLHNLHSLIVGVPLERFTEAAQQDRCLETKPLATSALRYLLNWQMTHDSWVLLTTPRRPPARKKLGTPREISGPAEQAAADRQVIRTWGEMYRAYRREQVEARLAILAQTLAPFRARGVKILFWRPPLNADVRSLIAKAQVQPVWESLLPRLQAAGEVVDLTSDQDLDGTRYEFNDPVHTKNAPQILVRLLHGLDGGR